MSDKHFVGLDLTGFEDHGEQKPISRVTFLRDDENAVTAGDDTGREIVADCPHATQAMADAALAKLKGLRYHAYTADEAGIDPAAELGDAVTASGVYSVISRFDDDGSGYSGLSAPGDRELEDEYPADGPVTQEFNRKVTGLYSYINKTATQISMGVVDEINQTKAEFNISLENINQKLTDEVNGLEAEFNLSFDEISQRLTNEVDGLSSSFTQSLTEIDQRLTDEVNGLEASVNVSFEEINQKLTDDINGLNASFTLSLNEIDQRLTNSIEGVESSLTVSMNGLEQRVNNTEGTVATLSNTVNGFSATYATKTGVTNEIKSSIEGISLSASNGTTSSTISIKSGGVTVDSATIEFTGDIVFKSNLTDGTTRISGNNIRTGYVDAARLNLYGPMEVYEDDEETLGGYIGYVTGDAYNDNGSVRTTSGIGVKAPGDAGYDGGMVVCTNAGARLTFGEDMFGDTSTIACVGRHCYSSRTMETFSDRRLKNSIEYDLLERYESFYRSLRPCRFKMNEERNGNYHMGFIAQDVAQSLEENGFAKDELEALTQFESRDGTEGMYTIGYSEFVAMNTAMIQQLLEKVESLEEEIKSLKGMVNNG